MAVDKLKTTTSALLILLDCGRYPASAMHVKKLSIARARQYNDISIRLLFFSMANARPVGNCTIMQSSASITKLLIHKNKWMQLVTTYRSHGHHWNVTSFQNPEKKARPHPEEE